MFKFNFKIVVSTTLFCTFLLCLCVFSSINDDSIIAEVNAQEMAGEEGGGTLQRTVKNYDLVFSGLGIWNSKSRLDSEDCKKKMCFSASENGTCTFITPL